MRLGQVIVLFSLALVAARGMERAWAEDDWKKMSEKDGLTLYERAGTSAGLLAFRGEGILNSPLRTVAAVILDRARLPEWVDNLEQVRRVRTLSDQEFIEYSYVGTPFVIKDRDFLSRVSVQVLGASESVGSKKLVVLSRSTEDADAPVTRAIRGEVRETRFELSCDPAHPGQTRFTALIDVDPKGSVAHWVVNLFQKDWPRNAYRAVQKRLTQMPEKEPSDWSGLLKQLDGC